MLWEAARAMRVVGAFARFLLAVQEDEVYAALADDPVCQPLFALRAST